MTSPTNTPETAGPKCRGDITITHTYLDGTTLDGTTREDTEKGSDTRNALDLYAWHWRPYAGWHQRSSRNQPARQWRINATAEALRALGWNVTVDIDNTPRDPAEVEAERAQRMQEREEKLRTRAARHQAESDSRFARDDERWKHMPMGQPMIPGHHSYPADKRRRERARESREKAAELAKRARVLSDRADAAGRHMEHREHWARVASRVHDLETKLRRAKNANSAHVAKWETDLAYWREVRDEQIASGVNPNYSKDDVEKGDVVILRGSRRHPVLRVSEKTVTVGLFRGNSGKWMEHRVRYFEIWQVVKPEREGCDG